MEKYIVKENEILIEFLKKNGVAVKEERGNRIFPVSDKSIDVLNAFTKELNKKQVKIKFECKSDRNRSRKNKVKAVTYIDKIMKAKTVSG